jgi:hypothetical protein
VLCSDLLRLFVIESLLVLFDHVVFIVIFQLFLKVLVIIIFQHEVLLIIHELIDIFNHQALVHYVGCVALGVTSDVLRNLLAFRYHLNLLLL